MSNNTTTHDLGNGYTATRNGKLFEVMHNGVFIGSAIRLKTAQAVAREHASKVPA